MHKRTLETFKFFKDFFQLCKLLIVFLIMMYLLYWIQNIASFNWRWLDGFASMFNDITNFGKAISNASFKLGGGNFETKYLVGLIVYFVYYYICHFLWILTEKLEDKYIDSRQAMRKMEEEVFNKTLAIKSFTEQKQIQKYQIYVETVLKKQYQHKDFNIDMEAQNRAMNKFLMEKTDVTPIKFSNGFLYNFEKFENIDAVLEAFFKLFTSETPLNYIVCVNVIEPGPVIKENETFLKLIELKLEGKISMLSECAYRYNYNRTKFYDTTLLGLFQKDDETFEVHEFKKLN